MTPQTVNRLLQLLVNGPMMIRHSKKLKNKYFKIALGAGGAVIILMALNDILKDRELEKKQKEEKQNAAIKKLLAISE
jgi:small neutral amino acid transporter SnatA (MarC family)